MNEFVLNLSRDELLALSFSVHHTLLHLSLATDANKLCFARERELLGSISSKLNNLGL